MKRSISITSLSFAVLLAAVIAATAQEPPPPSSGGRGAFPGRPPMGPAMEGSGPAMGGMPGQGMPGMGMAPGQGMMGKYGGPGGAGGMMMVPPGSEAAHQAMVMEILREVLPTEAEHLEQLRMSEPEAYLREIHALTPEAMELREMRERDPRRYEETVKMHRFEHETRRIAEKARQLEGASRADVLEGLDQRLERIFDLKQQLREEEVERLQTELERLRRGLKRRQEQREEIIARRRAELLGEVEPLEW